MSESEPTSVRPPQPNIEPEQTVCLSRDSAGACGRGCVASQVVLPVEGENVEAEFSEEMHAEEEQEVQPVARLPSYTPTRSEYNEHCVTHNPYRPWCEHCVRGRGQEFGHFRRRGNDPNRVPLIAFDYCGLSDKGEIFGLEYNPEDASTARVLVVAMRTADDKQWCVFGHIVPHKGIDTDKFAVDCLVSDILWTGYTSVMLKSDNEPAILTLLIESLRELRINGLTQVMSENSPEYDPQANGAAENAVKAWKGMFKTQKSSLESSIGLKIPVRHPIIAWIAKWSSDVMVWQLKGHDGLTPYQRIRGKPFHSRLAALGEIVRFKTRKNEPLPDDGEKWHDGVFLGIDRRTGQYIVNADDGIKHARTIIRIPDSEKWKTSACEKVRVTPYKLHEPRPHEIVFKDPARLPGIPPPDQPVVRRVYLKPSDFANPLIGYTRGCARCDFDRAYGPGRCKTNHSEACRTRVEAELAKTPEGQARIAAAKARFDRAAWQAGGGVANEGIAESQGERGGMPVVVPSNDDDDVPVSFLPLPRTHGVVDHDLENSQTHDPVVGPTRFSASPRVDAPSGARVVDGDAPSGASAVDAPVVESAIDVDRAVVDGMDLDVVEVKPCVDVCGVASVIAEPSGPAEPAFERNLGCGVGLRGSSETVSPADRISQKRSDKGKAATPVDQLSKTITPSDAAGQRGTQTSVDRGGSTYLSISVPKASSFDASVFSVIANVDYNDDTDMRKLMGNMTRDLASEMREMDFEVLSVIRSMVIR